MLEIVPEKRITLEQALKHPFFVQKVDSFFDDFDDFGFSSPESKPIKQEPNPPPLTIHSSHNSEGNFSFIEHPSKNEDSEEDVPHFGNSN